MKKINKLIKRLSKIEINNYINSIIEVKNQGPMVKNQNLVMSSSTILGTPDSRFINPDNCYNNKQHMYSCMQQLTINFLNNMINNYEHSSNNDIKKISILLKNNVNYCFNIWQTELVLIFVKYYKKYQKKNIQMNTTLINESLIESLKQFFNKIIKS